MSHFKKSFVHLILFLIVIQALLLRLLWLDRIPPSLYTDEINQGYNAYSILKTGRDEHGVFLPVSLRSFGDWKPPLSSYLMVPFIYFMGLNELSVRLPSAILGIGTVILTFYLVKELFKERKEAIKLALIAALFLSLSPWHILQSRSAMLVVVGLFFLEGGIYFYLKGLTNPKFLLIAFTFFALSIYAYYGLRIVTPLLLIFLLTFFRKKILIYRRLVLTSLVWGGLLLFPLIYQFFHEPNVIFGRAKTVSIFYDQGVKLRQWELIAQDGVKTKPLITRFFHNNFYLYGKSILQHFFSHFDGIYLFLKGDESPPFRIPSAGILYLIDSLFILIGIIFLFKEKYKSSKLIFYWFLIAFIPAAFTFMTPSSNRTFNSIIPLIVVASLGLLFLLKEVVKNKYVLVIVVMAYSLSFAHFMKQYFLILPLKYADWWNYGWRETVYYLKTIEPNYENIIVSDMSGMPYIYFLFYNQYPPDKYHKEAVRTYVADQFGYEHVEGFGKYWFFGDFNWKNLKDTYRRKTIYVVPASQESEDKSSSKIINYPNGLPAIKLFIHE